jgi:hypothetical protein
LATAGLADEAKDSDCECCAPKRFWTVSGGLDFSNTYFHRGYQLLDDGLVARPFATLSCAEHAGDYSITPYLTIAGNFGSANDHATGGSSGGHGHGANRPAASGDGAIYEVMIGTVFNTGNGYLDLKYIFDNHGINTNSSIQEIGARIWYDHALDSGPEYAIGIRPSFAVYQETFDPEGGNELYFEAAIEPYVRCEMAGIPVGVSVPITIGMSPNGYYLDSTGSDEFAGFLSIALSTSIPLQCLDRFGSWFLSASVEYLHLIADSAVASTGGDDNQFVARIGLGFRY